jgi:hypothetical protein
MNGRFQVNRMAGSMSDFRAASARLLKQMATVGFGES